MTTEYIVEAAGCGEGKFNSLEGILKKYNLVVGTKINLWCDGHEAER